MQKTFRQIKNNYDIKESVKITMRLNSHKENKEDT